MIGDVMWYVAWVTGLEVLNSESKSDHGTLHPANGFD